MREGGEGTEDAKELCGRWEPGEFEVQFSLSMNREKIYVKTLSASTEMREASVQKKFKATMKNTYTSRNIQGLAKVVKNNSGLCYPCSHTVRYSSGISLALIQTVFLRVFFVCLGFGFFFGLFFCLRISNLFGRGRRVGHRACLCTHYKFCYISPS